MIEPNFLNALREICRRLENSPVDWAITGSMGMVLQGMEMDVHDIDIQTDQRGAYQIETALQEYVATPVRYLASERIRSHLGALEIFGVKVEIMGDVQKLLADHTWEPPVLVERHRRWIRFEDIRVPVLSLDYEYEAYQKLNRPEKAAQIKQWLDENQH